MNTRQSSRKGDTLVYEGEVGQIPAQEAEQRTETDVWKTNKQNDSSSTADTTVTVGLPRYVPEILDERQSHGFYGRFESGDESTQRPRTHEHPHESVSVMEEHDEVERLKRRYTQILREKDKRYNDIEEELKLYRRRSLHYKVKLKRLLRNFQAKCEQLESDKHAIEEKHNAFIRRQQEVSFRQMTTSRWMPAEDSKVIEDLERLKRDMRTWAKKVSINNLDDLHTLDESQMIAFETALAEVVVFENGKLPQGLSPRKSPALLLTALLSHDIYTTLFQSPFFFIGNSLLEGQPEDLEIPWLRQGLESIYHEGLRSNENDANTWRSQTLRLMLPPVDTASQSEKWMNEATQIAITERADSQALKFLGSPAQHFINDEARTNCAHKLKAIYREAANISYNSWTRRTYLEHTTLESMRGLYFDPDDKRMVAHSSVDYEIHDDQLKGRPISVIVHPLLRVFGTDDGKDYDQCRVWAPAEVWLDSSGPSTK